MPKRLVKKISPINENQQNTIVPFSELLTERNIILLGEAGAGKSHLFKLANDYENGRYFKAYSFSSFRGKCNHSVIYIDGLDEKRSRSDDFDSIDNIIEKIWTIKPEKLRLSCRVADWLGETDLQQFKDYFEENGGYCVVELQKLSNDEINNILDEKGIIDKPDFIEKANEKSIESLLSNPQTLIMLADVFNKNGHLPSSKKKLYDEAVTILLEEPNEIHLDKALGHYSIELLKEAAGLICLSLLLADIESISLKPSKNYYAHLPFDKQILLAALSKRAFIVSNNHVIYAHRTIAEYLAACYLIHCIRHKGLSITRVQNWLGFNGYPATELRGLYAWLTQLLPEYSYQLLTKDPYAVLVYGDVYCLIPSAKKALFNALVELSKENPW